jgi:superfamily II DNA or RNA helicase
VAAAVSGPVRGRSGHDRHDACAIPPDHVGACCPCTPWVARWGPTKEPIISTTPDRPRRLGPEKYRAYAQAHVDGTATEQQIAALEAHPDEWVKALEGLRVDVLRKLDTVQRQVQGPERALVLADFDDERERLETQLTALTGQTFESPALDEPEEDVVEEELDDEPEVLDGEPQLQLSWHDGAIVAWAAARDAEAVDEPQVLERLAAAGSGTSAWSSHEPVPLPRGAHAPSVAAPVQSSLGWLVSLGATAGDDSLGASVTWMGLAAALAVRLVADGRMVPQLQKLPDEGKGGGKRGTFAVRWEPTLIDHDELTHLVKSLPAGIAALEKQKDPRAVTRMVVAGFVDAICRDAAGRVEVPAPPPSPRSASEVAETVLARLNGSAFEAPTAAGTEIGKGLQTWAKNVTGAARLQLVVQLDPPDDSGAWHLRTLVDDGRRKPELVEAAMSRSKHNRKENIKHELERLEGLYEPLQRGKEKRRGQVILSQDEAWDLMSNRGPVLTSAGFEVRVPPMSPKKAKPALRITASESGDTAVGAQQLTAVQWSAVFGDVELTAEQIQELSAQSRPLVKAHGQWVPVDHADLEAAAAALAERADRSKMTGAEMLRHALGLDGVALGNPVSVVGDGWAANLLKSAREIPEQPPTQPEGFQGELRSYQANALAWLDFLDKSGLGGCLALDMGLGKTPTLLAHLMRTRGQGPALVIAPPAVVGNWASEAARFVPDLDVAVHHGQNRADEEELASDVVADHDVVITTYGTALRDIEALVDVAWSTIVLDEAQVIKNPASETAQQLRRLEARTRFVLTGTPIENGLGDLWALMDFVNPGLVGDRATFVAQMTKANEAGAKAESALKALNGVLVFRRTKSEPAIAAELPDRIDELDRCPMTAEQVGLYQAVLDELVAETADDDTTKKKGAVLAAITALKQICNHPAAYTHDDGPLAGRSGKLARLEEILDNVFASEERALVFTHFATWGERLADYLTDRFGIPIDCYHGGLSRGARDRMVEEFQKGTGPGALVLSLKAGGTGLNLTAASHVILYDRWWNPAVEDQARDRVWRIGQERTVVAHRLVVPGTVDERVEEVVAGKRRIADMTLPKSSTVGDLDSDQLRRALGIDERQLLTEEYLDDTPASHTDEAGAA